MALCHKYVKGVQNLDSFYITFYLDGVSGIRERSFNSTARNIAKKKEESFV